ncbi:MAG: DUF255 domain-containing protein [Epsilonproteobacteria bacterium]|nr:DUF255 domain-containing protein [Campylobacterota bacterium]OIO15689.1 MAG: thioredoxin [Helicobacteraceae bacterium CG1_02_36_14]PIP10387.1 MAG: thioredoxin [Sulfurimonas sp. CG23_combo_of_CG06-09_8_20_14_all_36_33]PIS24960.1 MAG: thioredoxin [Sulfurimonas sp. CG08_land_8_20_14_0_20_36_33]PIU34129.1 MAG: thioredoxin [Sulfurimonas sp. CG07_land_8_20_14_0_80_36_56]PIV04963.1 MAG: thioredoxin [Sulfurimonas sp. CG03_land_8_20_14_0_80_36_25]PIV35475.1 MAG: thioredoxin [Sulfurimonas sp. CG02_l
MKKIVLLLTLLTSSVFGEISWMKYKDAIAQAKAEKKIVMVMLSREGCQTCEYMKDIVFENEKVMAAFEKNFLGVYIDIHDDYIPNDLSYMGTPTFHFLNGFERKLDRIDGGVNSLEFIEKLKEVQTK